MLDPFRALAPEQFKALWVPVADALSLDALPHHAHEVCFALGLYAFMWQTISPAVSASLFPATYRKLDKNARVNWDVHVVSFVQACIVNGLSLYVIFFDKERQAWREDGEWEMRIWGYSGLVGLTQSFALGYFLWDLYMCLRYIHIFGWSMVVHAIASSTMFTFGYRPFIHFYCPIFLLHELSTPFLNIHWFCDKLGLTGSIYQAINGALLVVTFFGARLVWGAYGSYGVSMDVYRAVTVTPRSFADRKVQNPFNALDDPSGQTTVYMTGQNLPLWLGISYVASNVALTLLNTFWFSKMVQAIRKRFDPPFGTKKKGDSQDDSKQRKVE